MRISDWSSDVCSSDLYGGWRRGLSGRDPDVLVSWAGVSSAARRGRSDRTGVARSRDIGRSESGDAVPYRARDREASGSAVRLLKDRSEEHTSELQSLMRISYAVFCLKKKKIQTISTISQSQQRHTSPTVT